MRKKAKSGGSWQKDFIFSGTGFHVMESPSAMILSVAQAEGSFLITDQMTSASLRAKYCHLAEIPSPGFSVTSILLALLNKKSPHRDQSVFFLHFLFSFNFSRLREAVRKVGLVLLERGFFNALFVHYKLESKFGYFPRCQTEGKWRAISLKHAFIWFRAWFGWSGCFLSFFQCLCWKKLFLDIF